MLHAGNIGLSQDLDIVLHAAEQLRDRPDIVFVFVGDGAKKQDLQDLAATARSAKRDVSPVSAA